MATSVVVLVRMSSRMMTSRPQAREGGGRYQIGTVRGPYSQRVHWTPKRHVSTSHHCRAPARAKGNPLGYTSGSPPRRQDVPRECASVARDLLWRGTTASVPCTDLAESLPRHRPRRNSIYLPPHSPPEPIFRCRLSNRQASSPCSRRLYPRPLWHSPCHRRWPFLRYRRRSRQLCRRSRRRYQLPLRHPL